MFKSMTIRVPAVGVDVCWGFSILVWELEVGRFDKNSNKDKQDFVFSMPDHMDRSQ